MKLIYDIRPTHKNSEEIKYIFQSNGYIVPNNKGVDYRGKFGALEAQRIIDLRGTYTLIKESDKIVKEIRKTIDEL